MQQAKENHVTAQTDDDALPAEGPADTIPHISLSLILPAVAAGGPTSVGSILTNVTLALQFRTVIATAAGEDDAAATYSLLMEWEDLGTSEITDYSLADDFNRYPEAALPPARRLALEGAEGAEGAVRGARRLPPSVGFKATMWFMYGHDFLHVGDSKDIDGSALASTMAAALALPATWAGFMAGGGGSATGLTDAELAAMVDASSVQVVLPRLRYRPTAFGDLEGTTVGSLIGIAVFVLAVVFVAIPGIVEKFKASRAAQGAAVKAV